MSKILNWFKRNLRNLLIAFVLALTVWVLAVTTSDPDRSDTLPQPVMIEYVGQDPALLITNSHPASVEVSLQAPESVWEQLLADPTAVRAFVDLSRLATGTHRVEVRIQVATSPVRILSITPAAFNLSLEPLASKTLAVELVVSGEPAIGFQVGAARISPPQITLSGPESLIDQVTELQAPLDLTEARSNIETDLSIVAVDSEGLPIPGLTLTPSTVKVTLPISQIGGYRDLVVKVVTVGHAASGYRLSSVAAFPSIVTVYSATSAVIESLPGFVETMPLDLSGASENLEARLDLVLPADVTLVSDQTVLVQVGIEPIEDSLTVAYRPVIVTGLTPGLQVTVSPGTVDVILAGPIPALNSLLASEVRVFVDVSGFAAGTYQVAPSVTLPLEDIIVQSILPGLVQVTISPAPTP